MISEFGAKLTSAPNLSPDPISSSWQCSSWPPFGASKLAVARASRQWRRRRRRAQVGRSGRAPVPVQRSAGPDQCRRIWAPTGWAAQIGEQRCGTRRLGGQRSGRAAKPLVGSLDQRRAWDSACCGQGAQIGQRRTRQQINHSNSGFAPQIELMPGAPNGLPSSSEAQNFCRVKKLALLLQVAAFKGCERGPTSTSTSVGSGGPAIVSSASVCSDRLSPTRPLETTSARAKVDLES